MTGITGIVSGVAVRAVAGKALVKAKSMFDAIPPKVKLAIAIALACIALFFVHQHYAHKALDQAFANGVQAERDRAAKELAKAHQKALGRRDQAERTAATISNDVRTKHETDLRRIASNADELRLRGPGAASAGRLHCPALPDAGGGHEPERGSAADGVAQVPPDEGLAVVPWTAAVGYAELADANRSEVLAWRDWYAREAAAWEAFRASTTKEEPTDGRR